MKHFKITVFALLAVSLFSCSNDDDNNNPVPVNEEEVITTVEAVFTPNGGGIPVTLLSRDLDGDGPDAPVVTVSGSFMTATTYNGSVRFLNELENPAENITEEIEEEDDEHQIFYQQSGNIGTFTYAAGDTDVNGKPVGLRVNYTTPATAAAGNITITLRHEPAKDAAGVTAGNIANAGGSTDAEVTFSVSVQ